MERFFTLEAQVHLRKAWTNNFIYLEGGLNWNSAGVSQELLKIWQLFKVSIE